MIEPARSTNVAGMTDNPTKLAAAVLAVGLSALGCGAATSYGNTGTERDLSGPLNTDRPTVGKLDPDLLDALQAAAEDALADGVRITVTSGWRSRSHQQRLFTEAVTRYGSEEEASRWVSTPDTSAHVTGDAVDIGPTDAADWLGQHGEYYGLCQSFANEIWHFELATTPGGTCPDPLPDSSYRG
jgi:hypothetical protein